MGEFEAPARDFREHGREEQGVCVAHERDLDAAVERVPAFERARGRKPGEATPDDDDPSTDWHRRARSAPREPARSDNGVRDRPDDEAEKHPTDELRERRTQADGAPLRATAVEQRQHDDAGHHPRCDADDRAGRGPVVARSSHESRRSSIDGATSSDEPRSDLTELSKTRWRRSELHRHSLPLSQRTATRCIVVLSLAGGPERVRRIVGVRQNENYYEVAARASLNCAANS